MCLNKKTMWKGQQKKLGINQSTLSRQLIQLEQLFAFDLFQKDGREKKMTLFAENLCLKVEPLLKNIKTQITISQTEFLDEKKIKLTLGGRLEFLKNFLNHRDFDGQWDILNLSSQQVIQSLKNKNIDCGLTHLNFESYDYQSIVLRVDYPVIIIPKEYIEKSCSLKSWSQMCSDFPVVTYNQDLLFLSEFKEIFKIQKTIEIKMLFPDWSYVEEACYQQKGWSIIPSQFVSDERKCHIIRLPKEDQYSFKMYLYYRKEYSKMKWFKEKILLKK